jgi:crotonobetainyl-CoA:carnitine CoA-transferase CaiB-like acyl-CoA transferase
MIQAMAGLMSITGEEDGKPGGGPMKVGIPILDLMTGMYATVAVLAALAGREHTGRGDYIDLAMFDVQAAVLANQAMNFFLSGRTPRRYGNGHPNIMPQHVFKCSDGYMVLACGTDAQYVKLCEVLGDAALKDERYVRNKGRVEHRDELLGRIGELFAQWKRSDLLDALERAGVPAGPINTIPEVFEDPHAKHRGVKIEMNHPLSGKVTQVANPMRFADAAITYDRHPPLLGEHTDQVLHELGMSDAEIAALRRDAVI